MLVEEFIPGREFTVAVVDGEAWPVLEIVAKGGWYGYEEKYVSDETTYPFPSDPFLAKVQQLAVDSYRAFDCRGMVRIDFRIDKDNNPFILELNTLPGMTEHSLVPKAAAKMGVSFPELCDRILSSAKFDRMK